MQQVRKFRMLRMKYGISVAELAQAARVSPQRISQMELDLHNEPNRSAQMVQNAFIKIIAERSRMLDGLRLDFVRHRDTLLDLVEEPGYEL